MGVARQYCGQLGKQDNCQVAVSLSVANEHASLPIAFRLYLPEDWAADPIRRAKAGVPEDVMFKTKPQIALDQIKAARAEGVPEGVVLADAGYGINTAFRTALTRMCLTYVVGIQSSAQLWPPGSGPLPPKAWSGQGRPPTLIRRDEHNKPKSARQLAKSLSADAWRDVAWREGVDKSLHSRFASLRVRPAHSDYWRSQPYPEEWLIVEWPQGESAPTKYWLSTLPADADLETLVATAKMRWRIERDYQELKQEGRIEAVVATRSLSADRRSRSSASAGVFQSSVFRGRELRAAATAAISLALCMLRSVPLGKWQLPE